MRAWLAALLLGFCACAAPGSAAAALSLCNRTSYIVYAATGLQSGGTMQTRGWTRILPGGCTTALSAPLGSGSAYVYARTSRAYSGAARAWGGEAKLCARDGDFTISMPSGDSRCETQQAYALPFSQIDNRGKASWTMTFYQSADRVSATAARDAGLIRLLKDAGEKAAKPAKALADFRARMKMPANVPVDALFDALETQAMRVSAPAGYTICNDTDAQVFAAVAVPEGKHRHIRGWWQVLPGACAQAITEPLHTDRVWLLVEDGKGRKLVTGSDQFCITQIPFDIEATGNCQARGLVPAGFARTDVKGRTGHVAHIGETGLVAAQQELE